MKSAHKTLFFLDFSLLFLFIDLLHIKTIFHSISKKNKETKKNNSFSQNFLYEIYGSTGKKKSISPGPLYSVGLFYHIIYNTLSVFNQYLLI